MLPQIVEFTDKKGNEMRIVIYAEDRLERKTIGVLERNFNKSFAAITLKFHLEITITKFFRCELLNAAIAVLLSEPLFCLTQNANCNDLVMIVAGSIGQGLSTLQEVQDNPQLLADFVETVQAVTEAILADPAEADSPEEIEAAEKEAIKKEEAKKPLPKHFDFNDLLREAAKDKERRQP